MTATQPPVRDGYFGRTPGYTSSNAVGLPWQELPQQSSYDASIVPDGLFPGPPFPNNPDVPQYYTYCDDFTPLPGRAYGFNRANVTNPGYRQWWYVWAYTWQGAWLQIGVPYTGRIRLSGHSGILEDTYATSGLLADRSTSLWATPVEGYTGLVDLYGDKRFRMRTDVPAGWTARLDRTMLGDDASVTYPAVARGYRHLLVTDRGASYPIGYYYQDKPYVENCFRTEQFTALHPCLTAPDPKPLGLTRERTSVVYRPPITIRREDNNRTAGPFPLPGPSIPSFLYLVDDRYYGTHRVFCELRTSAGLVVRTIHQVTGNGPFDSSAAFHRPTTDLVSSECARDEDITAGEFSVWSDSRLSVYNYGVHEVPAGTVFRWPFGGSERWWLRRNKESGRDWSTIAPLLGGEDLLARLGPPLVDLTGDLPPAGSGWSYSSLKTRVRPPEGVRLDDQYTLAMVDALLEMAFPVFIDPVVRQACAIPIVTAQEPGGEYLGFVPGAYFPGGICR